MFEKSAMQAKEHLDGSVSIISNKKISEWYFSTDFKVATIDGFAEFMRGLFQPVADRMGAKSSVELKDGFLALTLVGK